MSPGDVFVVGRLVFEAAVEDADEAVGEGKRLREVHEQDYPAAEARRKVTYVRVGTIGAEHADADELGPEMLGRQQDDTALENA